MITGLQSLGWVLMAATWACWLASFAARARGLHEAARWLWDASDWPLAGMCACAGIGSALQGEWWEAALFGGMCALIFWQRHRKRRKRGRAPRMLGYKAKAALAAIVRKARETAQPRPVLRPVPQGGFR